MSYRQGNLYEDPSSPSAGERFELLAEIEGARIEQIVSSHAPDLVEYDQDHAEWVVLLTGCAELEVAGERHSLRPGDYMVLPARTRHRLLAVSHGARWLAVHARAP